MRMRTSVLVVLAAFGGGLVGGCVEDPAYESCPMSPNIINLCEEMASLQEGAPETAGTCVVADHPQCTTDACMLFGEKSFCTSKCGPTSTQPRPAAGCDAAQGFRPIAFSRFVTEVPSDATDAEERVANACATCTGDGETCDRATVERSAGSNVERVERVFCAWSECAKRDDQCASGIECVQSDDCAENGKCVFYLFDIENRVDLYYCVKSELALP